MSDAAAEQPREQSEREHETALAGYRTMLERALERLEREPLEGVEPTFEPAPWR